MFASFHPSAVSALFECSAGCQMDFDSFLASQLVPSSPPRRVDTALRASITEAQRRMEDRKRAKKQAENAQLCATAAAAREAQDRKARRLELLRARAARCIQRAARNRQCLDLCVELQRRRKESLELQMASRAVASRPAKVDEAALQVVDIHDSGRGSPPIASAPVASASEWHRRLSAGLSAGTGAEAMGGEPLPLS